MVWDAAWPCRMGCGFGLVNEAADEGGWAGVGGVLIRLAWVGRALGRAGMAALGLAGLDWDALRLNGLHPERVSSAHRTRIALIRTEKLHRKLQRERSSCSAFEQQCTQAGGVFTAVRQGLVGGATRLRCVAGMQTSATASQHSGRS